MESDHRPSPARCNVCSQVFPSKNKAREHSKAMGHFPTDIVRICDECDATFASNADQGEHSVRTGHLKNSYTSAPTASTSANTGNSFVCANCDTSYPNEDILAAHRLVVHKQEYPQSGRAILDGMREANYDCPICQAKFHTNLELVEHVMHTSSCNECKICLPPWQDLEDHYWDSAMHPKCKPCALVFRDKTEWSAHKQVCPIAPLGAAEGPPKTQRRPANTRPSGQNSPRAGPSGSRSGKNSSRGGQGSRAGHSSASSGRSASSKMQRSPPRKPSTPSTSVEGTSSDSPPVSTSSGSFAGNASSGLGVSAKMPPLPKAATSSARTSTYHNTAFLESHGNTTSAVVEAPTTALPPRNVSMASQPQNSQSHRQNLLSHVGSQLSSISASKGTTPTLEPTERGGAHGLRKPLVAASFPSGDSLPKPNAPSPELAGHPISVQRTTSKSLRALTQSVTTFSDRSSDVFESARASSLDDTEPPTAAASPRLSTTAALSDGLTGAKSRMTGPSAVVAESPRKPPAATAHPSSSMGLRSPVSTQPLRRTDGTTNAARSHMDSPLPIQVPSSLSTRSTPSVGGASADELPSYTPKDRHDAPAVDNPPAEPGVPTLSWHCRSCLRDPCLDPVSTICGHLLCYQCMLRELRTNMSCPACKKVLLIPLHVGLSV